MKRPESALQKAQAASAGQLRDDLLNGQLIETLFESKVLIEGSTVFAFGRTTSDLCGALGVRRRSAREGGD